MLQALRELLHPGDLGEEELRERVESFLRFALARAPSGQSRTTDGIEHLRWVDRSPSAFRLAGKTWELPSSALQTFWLEVSEEGAGGPLRWTLHYGIESATAGSGFARNAADRLTSPAAARWALILAGDRRLPLRALATPAGGGEGPGRDAPHRSRGPQSSATDRAPAPSTAAAASFVAAERNRFYPHRRRCIAASGPLRGGARPAARSAAAAPRAKPPGPDASSASTR